MSKRKLRNDPLWSPVIYSLAVMPGLGQYRLGYRYRGLLFVVLTLACLAGFVVQFTGPFQAVLMAHLDITGDATHSAPRLLPIVVRWVVMLLLVWAGSGVDAYFLSAKLLREHRHPVRYEAAKIATRKRSSADLPPPPTPKLGG